MWNVVALACGASIGTTAFKAHSKVHSALPQNFQFSRNFSVPWESLARDRFNRVSWAHHGFAPRPVLRDKVDTRDQRAHDARIAACKEQPGAAQRAQCYRARSNLAIMSRINARLRTSMARSLGSLRNPRSKKHGARLVYVDLGAREPNSSILTFVRDYPHGDIFDELVAFEADARFAPLYASSNPLGAASAQPITLVPGAVATFEGECFFSRNSSLRAHMSPSGDFVANADPRKAQANFMEPARCLDFPKWLRANVAPRDLVVVKMDLEGTEFELVPQLLRDGDTLRLIDELFIECHHLETWSNGPHRYAECLEMYRALQDAGVWTHEWF